MGATCSVPVQHAPVLCGMAVYSELGCSGRWHLVLRHVRSVLFPTAALRDAVVVGEDGQLHAVQRRHGTRMSARRHVRRNGSVSQPRATPLPDFSSVSKKNSGGGGKLRLLQLEEPRGCAYTA